MKVIVAARLSVLSDGSTGLDSQEKEALAWAERNGHQVVTVVTDGISGAKPILQRRNLKPYMSDPELMQSYDGILVLKFDRLTRGDSRETRAIEQWADDNAKALLTTEGLVFPAEGMEGVAWDVAKRMAHAEWLSIRERYLRSQRYLKARGSLVGKPPVFYRIGPGLNRAGEPIKTLVPTDEGRKYVPAIFSKVIAGEPLTAIAAWLDQEGVKPAGERTSGKHWSEDSLARVIKSSTYAGLRKAADGTVELECEALVSIDTQQQAIAMLAKRVKPGRATVKHAKALLSALKCGNPECDATGTPDKLSPMYRIQTKEGWYYRCKGTGPQRKGCGNMVALAELDDLVTAAFETWHGQPHMDKVYVPGDSTADAIDRLRLEMTAALRTADTAAMAGIVASYTAKIAELESQPSTEGHWETTTTLVTDETGDTRALTAAEHFLNLDPDGRRTELGKHDIRALKDGREVLVTVDGIQARRGGRSAIAEWPEA